VANVNCRRLHLLWRQYGPGLLFKIPSDLWIKLNISIAFWLYLATSLLLACIIGGHGSGRQLAADRLEYNAHLPAGVIN
jgi:hypothetical protein